MKHTPIYLSQTHTNTHTQSSEQLQDHNSRPALLSGPVERNVVCSGADGSGGPPMPSPSHFFPTLTGPGGPEVPSILLSQVTHLHPHPSLPGCISNITQHTEISGALKMSAVRLIQFRPLWKRTKADAVNKYCPIIWSSCY